MVAPSSLSGQTEKWRPSMTDAPATVIRVQQPPYYRIVPKTMFTAECVHCGRDILADHDEFVAMADAAGVEMVIDEDFWRCKCGAPLTEQEAELLAEGDPPYRWEHREPAT